MPSVTSALTPAVAVRALRLPFCTASALPWLLGLSATEDALRIAPALLGLAAVVLTHLSANLLNDHADTISGADRDPVHWAYFGGSKLVQEGVLSLTTYRNAALALAALAAVLIGTAGLLVGRPETILLYAAVIALAWSYSAPPLKLVYRGLGEICILLLFGPVCTAGAAFLQHGDWPPVAYWLIGLPPGLLTASILAANEVPDAKDDAAAGKRTLVVRLGRRGRLVYPALVLMSYVTVAGMVAGGMLTPLALLVLATLPLAWRVVRRLNEFDGDKATMLPAAREAILTQTLVSLILIGDRLWHAW